MKRGNDGDSARISPLHHFSEDGSIQVFDPHVPITNPAQSPAVWAIDAAHAPLYWFPRDCPRVAVWPRSAAERAVFQKAFATTSDRVHVIEFRWLDALQSTKLFRYDFEPGPFEPWAEAAGQWITSRSVVPLRVSPVGDLLSLHRKAGIELRLVDSLRPVADLANDDRWDFSIVRLANAGSREC